MNKTSDSNASYADQGILFLRLCLGVIFFLHGYPKLLAGPDTWEVVGATMSNIGIGFYPQIWGFLAAITELGGGICLLFGILFRPACLMLAFTMVVAFGGHLVRGDPFQISSHSLTAAIVFIALFSTGPGRFTVATNPTRGSGD